MWATESRSTSEERAAVQRNVLAQTVRPGLSCSYMYTAMSQTAAGREGGRALRLDGVDAHLARSICCMSTRNAAGQDIVEHLTHGLDHDRKSAWARGLQQIASRRRWSQSGERVPARGAYEKRRTEFWRNCPPNRGLRGGLPERFRGIAPR